MWENSCGYPILSARFWMQKKYQLGSRIGFPHLFSDEKQCIEQLWSYNQIFWLYGETLQVQGKHRIRGLIETFTEHMARLLGTK